MILERNISFITNNFFKVTGTEPFGTHPDLLIEATAYPHFMEHFCSLVL